MKFSTSVSFAIATVLAFSSSPTHAETAVPKNPNNAGTVQVNPNRVVRPNGSRSQPVQRFPIQPSSQRLVARCPEGTVLTPWDQPIYDENGLFVIGSKKVFYCLPEDLQPQG